MLEKTIPLVDDGPEIVKTMQLHLQQEGYDMLVAYNGTDRLVIEHGYLYLPDCIVLDVMLPDHNGWEIAMHTTLSMQS